jgi:hypothetical protein
MCKIVALTMLVIGVIHIVKIILRQVELLSLMSTADIRAIGADVLLTWGGRILTGLTHPQVSRVLCRWVGGIEWKLRQCCRSMRFWCESESGSAD